MHFTIPLVPYGTHATSGAKTYDAHEIPQFVKHAYFQLYVGAGVTGTTPTLDVKVQGAPTKDQGAAWYTALPCYRTGTAPNSIGGLMAFTQATTAGTQRKYTDWLAPYVRAVATLGGSSPSFPFGLQMVCIAED